jgi:K+ transporter
MPLLRAKSRVRSSSAVPTLWLCQGFSILKAASASLRSIDVVAPEFKHYVLPITIAVLCVLFWMQQRGTERIGALFGPIMCAWFATLAVLGVVNILHAPTVLAALSPI